MALLKIFSLHDWGHPADAFKPAFFRHSKHFHCSRTFADYLPAGAPACFAYLSVCLFACNSEQVCESRVILVEASGHVNVVEAAS